MRHCPNIQNRFRWLLVLLLWAMFPVTHAKDCGRRVIVLGFDGLDPTLTRKWMEEGKMPHLSYLASLGTFCELATANPAQSPVAWATFATGKNPGRHNIYDFLRRGDEDYHPRLALIEVRWKPVLGGRLGKGLLSLLFGALLAGGTGLALKLSKKTIVRRGQIALTIAGLAVSGLIFYCLDSWLPERIPSPASLKRGQSVWTIAADHNVKTVVLQAPIAFPAERVAGGRLLCEFGVPDMAGTNGLWFCYSPSFQEQSTTETGGFRMPLVGKKPRWEGVILGPKNLLVAEEIARLTESLLIASVPEIKDIQNRLVQLKHLVFLTASLSVETSSDRLRLIIGDEVQELKDGQWSEWFTIPFKLNPLFHLKGMARVRVLSLNPPQLYMTPVQFHPEHLLPNADISFPSDFASELVGEVGLYPTLGWCEATNALKDDEITEQAFWEDLQYTMQCKEKIFLSELMREDWHLLMAFFYVTDRASHMYWRFLDPSHARHEDLKEMPEYRDNLLLVYQWVDSLVGKAMEKLTKEDVILVISDHGFAPFRWGVNLNTWLYRNEYLALRNPLERPLQVNDLYTSSLGQHIDWSRTRAYSMGLGNIFINVKGREPQGIVLRGEPYRDLCEELRSALSQLNHRGEPVIHQIYLRDEIYKGPCVEDAPDLVIGFNLGYRVSWQTTLGGVPDEVIESNLLKWSGDHCSVDPHLIPGVFFCNRRIKVCEPDLKDLAPTILSLFDIEIPPDMEGRPLLK